MKKPAIALIAAMLSLALLLPACGSAEENAGENAGAPAETAEKALGDYVYADKVVYTDYSQLTPYQKTEDVYVRYGDEPSYDLVPADDYGTLVPFYGKALCDEGGWSGYYLSGLCTMDGRVVVEPVYAVAEPFSYYSEEENVGKTLPLLRLCKVEKGDFPADPNSGMPSGARERYGVAAMDGSWYSGCIFSNVWACEKFVVGQLDGKALVLDAASGEELSSFDMEKEQYIYNVFEDGLVYLSTSWMEEDENGETVWRSAVKFYDLENNKEVGPFYGMGVFAEGLMPVKVEEDSLWGYVDRTGSWVIPEQYEQAYAFSDGRAAVLLPGENSYVFIDESGAAVSEKINSKNFYSIGQGWWSASDPDDYDTRAYLGPNGEQLLAEQEGYTLNYAGLGCFYYTTDKEIVLLDGSSGRELFRYALVLSGEADENHYVYANTIFSGERFIISEYHSWQDDEGNYDGESRYALLDRRGHVLYGPTEDYLFNAADDYGQRSRGNYVIATNSQRMMTLLDKNGKVKFSMPGNWVEVFGDNVFQTVSEDACLLFDENGKVLLRISFADMLGD